MAADHRGFEKIKLLCDSVHFIQPFFFIVYMLSLETQWYVPFRPSTNALHLQFFVQTIDVV